MLKKLSIVLTVAAAALGAGTILTSTAQAAPAGQSGQLGAAADTLNMIEKTQFFFGGREYCWYDDGWNGPGFYWCGEYLRRGFGWGGGYGWHGWRGGRGIGRVGRVGRVGVGRVGRVGRVGVGRVGRVGGVGRVGRVGRVGGVGRVGRVGRRSDITLKHDITLLGQLDNGLGFYRFSYNGSDKPYVGVMAQEVQTVMPKAVVHGSDGYLRVYYDKLGVTFQTYDQWVAAGAHVPTGAPVRH